MVFGGEKRGTSPGNAKVKGNAVVITCSSLVDDVTFYPDIYGKGTVKIGNHEFTFEPHDVLVAPSWAPILVRKAMTS